MLLVIFKISLLLSRKSYKFSQSLHNFCKKSEGFPGISWCFSQFRQHISKLPKKFSKVCIHFKKILLTTTSFFKISRISAHNCFQNFPIIFLKLKKKIYSTPRISSSQNSNEMSLSFFNYFFQFSKIFTQFLLSIFKFFLNFSKVTLKFL